MNTTQTLPAGGADTSVETMTTLLMRLHDAFIRDDDLDAILGAAAGPTGLSGSKRQKPRRARLLGTLRSIVRRRTDEVASDELPDVIRRAEHLSRMLGQLVNIAHQRAGGAPSVELAEVISHADRLRDRQMDREFAADRGHLRRLALATLALLELLTVDDDEPLPTFGEAPVPSGWSV